VAEAKTGGCLQAGVRNGIQLRPVGQYSCAMIPVIQGEEGRTQHRENSILKPRPQQVEAACQRDYFRQKSTGRIRRSGCEVL
jgi:hypothetical protein